MNERQRLQQIMEAEHLTAKQFADQVGISAGTISNIMGGRNNPSLDVLQAVLNRFRTVNSDWLILGIGSMYRPNGGQDGPQTSLFDLPPVQPETPAQPAPATAPTAQPTAPNQPLAEKKVAKIVVYYTDGTYEER
ncbi:MAG: helix-turn-helix domain-containing protein [Paludibacteraceae bacterium]|nr:helix-turn-helix domain-containing protein [Paludibacteraceae bacterium]